MYDLQGVPNTGRIIFLWQELAAFLVWNLEAHNSSKAHNYHVKDKDAKNNPQNSPMKAIIHGMQGSCCEITAKQFYIAYFIAKENVAFANFPMTYALHVKKDVDPGQTYFNHACRTFIDSIVGAIKNKS